jgi:hypothetical protein
MLSQPLSSVSENNNVLLGTSNGEVDIAIS